MVKHLKYVMKGSSIWAVGKVGRPKGKKKEKLHYKKRLKTRKYEYDLY